MRAAATLLFLVVTMLGAQTSAHHRKKSASAPKTRPSGADFTLALPLGKLTVEGNQRIPTAAILQMSGIKVGDLATKQAFDAAQQKILQSGFFDSVNYGFGPEPGGRAGFAGKFQVVEAKPLYKVQFAGFPATKEELNAYLKSRDPLYNGFAPPTQQILDRWAKYLDAFSASKNHPKKTVGKLLSTASGDYIIQFQPDEPLAAVARVEFTGSDSIDFLTLQNTIGAVAYGLPYSEENFREFLDHQVRPLYEARGILRVAFKDITTEPVPLPVKGLLVHVKVVEGPVFKLGKISFAGADEDERDHFAHISALKSGEVANFDQINAAAEKVKDSLRRSGFLHTTTAVERTLHDATKKVDVTIKVEHGAQYRFGTITITGLDLNGTAAVRKLWGKKDGDAYNPDYPEYFLKQVKDEGIFDHLGPTHADAKINEQTHVADITLVFSPEQPKPPGERRRPTGDV